MSKIPAPGTSSDLLSTQKSYYRTVSEIETPTSASYRHLVELLEVRSGCLNHFFNVGRAYRACSCHIQCQNQHLSFDKLLRMLPVNQNILELAQNTECKLIPLLILQGSGLNHLDFRQHLSLRTFCFLERQHWILFTMPSAC